LICPFKAVTGLPCPGCGMTRAFLHLADGDIAGAFHFHPLFWLVPILIVVMIFKHKPLIAKIYRNQRFWLGTMMLVVTVYIARLVLYFPHQAPLDLDADAVIPRLISSLF